MIDDSDVTADLAGARVELTKREEALGRWQREFTKAKRAHSRFRRSTTMDGLVWAERMHKQAVAAVDEQRAIVATLERQAA